MLKIDAHQHFWSPARGDYGWMNDNPSVVVIRRDFHPAHFDPFRERCGIDRSVLVQAAASVEETEYLLGIADATAWVGKVVGWIDFEDRDHIRHLERFARHQRFAGVRPMIQDIPDRDWMHRPDVQWAFAAIVDLDLTFDALGYPLHLEPFLRLFHRYPKMRTVIDHCMKPRIRDGAFAQWAPGIARLAGETSAFCKLSGLVTEAKPGCTAADLEPYAEHVLACFSSERVMWGSDWPVLELNGTYDGWHAMANALAGGTKAKEDIFGGTAARFYRIA